MNISKKNAWDLPTLLQNIPVHKAFDQSLTSYTSIRIGGKADVYVQVESLDILQRLHEIGRQYHVPLFVLGGGTNLLVRDGGIRGMVITLQGEFRTYHMETLPGEAQPEIAYVHAGVGATLSRLALQLGRQGWRGLEFAYGIPGTLGGALMMNAGTNLGDMRSVVVGVRMLCRNGDICELPVEALGLQYRTSAYPAGAILLGATLRVHRGDAQESEQVMRTAYKQRQRTQPLTIPNAGSIFKNPAGMVAGRLIDTLGLKGRRVGGAQISPIHANFIVNLGKAMAADVEALMHVIQEQVAAAYDVWLEPEVRLIGEEVCL